MWQKKLPDKPGRYFYRVQGEWGSYGVCLVAWTEPYVLHGKVTNSKLKAVSFSLWGSTDPGGGIMRGELASSPGWSYSHREDSDDVEFWSESVVAPPDFPGVPVDMPPQPIDAEIEASREETEKRQQENREREAEQAKVEAAAIKSAKAAGHTLFRCETCECLWKPDELVTVKKRACGNCSEEFFEGDEGRNCPSCNRPFTRLEEEFEGCPECLGDSGDPELTCILRDGEIPDESD